MADVCGATYYTRRTMRSFSEKRTCGLSPHSGRRHGQPKVVNVDAEPAGTCQACFRSQQTRHTARPDGTVGGALVLHGYRRPGWGYTVGKCYGAGYAPFEVSCERTKAYLAEVLRPALTRFEGALVQYHGRPDPISYTGDLYLGNFKHASVTVEVARDEPEGYKPTPHKEERDITYAGVLGFRKAGDVKMLHHPSYDECLKRAIREVESRIRLVKLDITTYEARISTWKPEPWPPVKVSA